MTIFRDKTPDYEHPDGPYSFLGNKWIWDGDHIIVLRPKSFLTGKREVYRWRDQYDHMA